MEIKIISQVKFQRPYIVLYLCLIIGHSLVALSAVPV